MNGFKEYGKFTDAEIVELAYKAWEKINDEESESRAGMEDDALFLEDHWSSKIRKERETSNRPCLQIPRINQFLNQIKNEQRQNAPAIKVSPVDDNADIKAAKYREGIIKHIQYDSNAVNAYQSAFDWAVDVGRGFFRVRTEYITPTSEDQKIVIDSICEPFNVYMGRHKKLDYSDSTHGFILQEYDREVFEDMYPDADPVSFAGENNKWSTANTVIVAEFYCKWIKKRTMLTFEDGKTIYKDEIPDKEVLKGLTYTSKVIEQPFIMWYKMTRQEILEKQEVPGRFIPIIPVVGVEKWLNGKLLIKGMVRDAKDVQKMYDYHASTEAEYLSMTVKPQYIVAKGQFENYKGYWKDANNVNRAFLPYQPVSHDNHMVPPPQRQAPPQIPAGIVNAKMSCVDDLKAVTGIYDSGLGNVGNEVSGRAILARQRESDTANYHYIDNMRVALTHAGRIINDWLPVYYDEGRIIKILGEEDEEEELRIGDRGKDGRKIELGSGEYDVVVTMGASYNTKRQEAAEAMLEFMRVNPNAMPLIWDLFVKNLDFPGAQTISERLKKTIPPNILEDQDNEQMMQAQMQQMQQQLQQAQQMMQALSAQNQELSQKLESKELDVEAKIEVAEMNNQTKLLVEQMKAAENDRVRQQQVYQEFLKSIQPQQKESVNV